MSCSVIRVCQEHGSENPRNVKKIALSGLKIAVIEDLSDCSVVEKVDISKNDISDARGLCKCESITWLNLSRNVLQSMDFVARLRRLTVLNLGYNSISDTSPVGMLRSLKALILNNNKIAQVSGLNQLVHLNTLVLSHNHLEEIDVGTLSALVKLQLSHNALKSFPDIRFNLELKSLLLNENQIDGIPDDRIGANYKLEIVEIANNCLKKIKHIRPLSTVKSIIRLNILGNDFSDESDYLYKVRSMFPTVKNLNTQPVHKLHQSADKKKVPEESAKRKVFSSDAEDESSECKSNLDDSTRGAKRKKIRSEEMNFISSEASENIATSDKTLDTFVSDSNRKKNKKAKKSSHDLDLSNTDSLVELASGDAHKSSHKNKKELMVPGECVKSSSFDNDKASKKVHKKMRESATVNDDEELAVDSELTAATNVVDVLKKSHQKKKGVPALDSRNSGVVKVIEIRNNKKRSIGGVELDSYELSFGSGIGSGWQ